MSRIKIDKNGKIYEYSYKVTSEEPLTVEVSFDSHSASMLTRVNTQWTSGPNQIQPPIELSISEIGKAIEKDYEG